MLDKQETAESGKMLALTLALTFFLLAVVGVVIRLAHAFISEGDKINQLSQGFRML